MAEDIAPWNTPAPGEPAPWDTPAEHPALGDFLGPAKRFLSALPGGVARGLTSIPRYLAGGMDPESIADIGPSRPEISSKQALEAGAEQRIATNKAIDRGISRLGLPQAQGRAGRFGETVGEFAGDPLSYLGPGGATRKAITAGLAGLGSEAAGQATGDAPAARIAGGMLGAGVPNALRRITTPLPIGPGRTAAVSTLRAQGVEPSAGDITGRRTLRHLEELGDQPLGGGSYTQARERIAGQFTNRLVEAMGEAPAADGTITPQMLQNADDRIGKMFDQAQSQLEVVADPQISREARQFRIDLKNERLPAATTDRILARFDDMTKAFHLDPVTGQRIMSGDTYAALTRKNTPLARAIDDADANISYWATRLRGIIDDAATRTNSVAVASSPQRLALDQLKEARRQWFHFLVARDLITRAGETAQSGYVTPQALRGALTRDRQNAARYALGRAELAPLSRAGNMILTQPRSSGTAERANVFHPNIVSAGMGLTGRAVNSPTAQAYLGNQLFPGSFLPASMRRALLPGIAQEAATDGLEQDDVLAR